MYNAARIALAFFLVAVSSCGSENSSPTTRGDKHLTTSLSCKEKILRDGRDSDGDGLSDAQEIYGWMGIVDNTTIPLFTDPTKADTDGDGRNDLDESSTHVFIGGPTSSITVAGHPAHRDAIVRVEAKGSQINGLPTSKHNTGWNIFELFSVVANDQFIFRDLQSSLWRGALGLTGPLGNGVIVNCADDNKSCLKVPEMRLIARFVDSVDYLHQGSEVVDIGSLMGPLNLSASIQRTSADRGRLLALRANDLDSDLANNSGTLHLFVRQISNTDYPQRSPTAEEENNLFAKICPPTP